MLLTLESWWAREQSKEQLVGVFLNLKCTLPVPVFVNPAQRALSKGLRRVERVEIHADEGVKGQLYSAKC